MRMGPKTCPTPREPVDEMAQYKSWLKWKENLCWKWHFNKGLKPEDIEDIFVRKPWDTPTDRAAPIVNDCPELEAMIANAYRDLFDPNQRRKIKDNLSKEQRSFINEVKTKYPQKGLRIRMEDKGHRFVIADAISEDTMIEDKLKNVEQYTEVDNAPI